MECENIFKIIQNIRNLLGFLLNIDKENTVKVGGYDCSLLSSTSTDVDSIQTEFTLPLEDFKYLHVWI